MSDQFPSPEERRDPPLTALVADIDPATRANVRAILTQHDPSLTVLEVGEGEAALAALTGRKPELAFVNVVLPGLSGAEALARAFAKGIRPYTVLLSTMVLPHWIEVAQRVGAAEFLKLPLDPRHVGALLATAARMRQPIKLLLVDGAANARQLVRRMLDKSLFAFDIDETDGGAHAVKLLRAGTYDLALIDWNLPSGIDGLETVCQGSEAAPRTRFLMMSAGDIGGFARSAKQFGVGAVLRKPFYGHDVDLAVHAAFGLRRSYLLNAILPEAERRRRAGQS